jgi:hypothetical protein
LFRRATSVDLPVERAHSNVHLARAGTGKIAGLPEQAMMIPESAPRSTSALLARARKQAA